MNDAFYQLPPGSHEAVEAGCLCPVLSNVHWHRTDDGVLILYEEESGLAIWSTEDCPRHRQRKVDEVQP